MAPQLVSNWQILDGSVSKETDCKGQWFLVFATLSSGPGDRIPVGGEIFRTCPDRPRGPPSFLYNGYRVFPGGKAVGAWRWSSTTSSAEVKERVELYLYSPSGPSWAVLGWTLPSLFLIQNSAEVQPTTTSA